MSTREIFNQTLLSASNISSSTTTSSVNCTDAVGLGFQAIFLTTVASLSGTLQIQGSLDNVNFADITSTQTVVTSSSLSYLLNYPGVTFTWTRARWAYVGGTGVGSMTVNMAKKSDVA